MDRGYGSYCAVQTRQKQDVMVTGKKDFGFVSLGSAGGQEIRLLVPVHHRPSWTAVYLC